ncbi:hypothetical protein [Nocardioides sp. zg-1230]|uniref:hypothetical protein n=1 Tax=Nocardioides sp. zg-1230 TaxID=2736601 RepID=UPI001556F057|nr:hypothetical protein [Nocardioides sp. zg-1230]NPC43122.1 hypothetical protein [Nocardioides sp. zg-1230]
MALNFGGQRIRITGVGPWSIQWEYLPTNREIVRRVLADIEIREVFYGAVAQEDPEFCRVSMMEVRDIMTGELARVEQGDALDYDLRIIRNAAKEFNTEAGGSARNFLRDPELFARALDTMRNAVAPPIRRMAVAYNVLIDHRLDAGLPPSVYKVVP